MVNQSLKFKDSRSLVNVKLNSFVRIHFYSLQEYIDELLSVGHELTSEIAENLRKHSSTQTNFARAALVLQNSSSIYSRKVEYLHTLVYKTLNSLINNANEKNSSKQSRSRTNADPDIDAFEEYDLDLDFLPLGEDILPTDDTGEYINLDDESEIMGAKVSSGNDTLDMTLENAQRASPSIMNLSAGVGMSGTRFDQTLTTVTANKNSMNSHAANNLLRNILDGNAAASGKDPSQATLRLMNGACDVAETGALHMPGTGMTFHLNHEEDYGYSARASLNMSANEDFLNERNDDAPVEFDNYDDGAFDDDNDDNGGSGFELNNSISDHSTGNAATLGQDAYMAKSAKPVELDPWAMLDPHDVGDTKHKPLHVGNTLRLPHDCEELPSDSVTGARTKKIPKAKLVKEKEVDYTFRLSTFSTDNFDSTIVSVKEALKRRSSLDENETDGMNDKSLNWQLPNNPLIFEDEFRYIAKAEVKRKTTEKRKLKRLQMEKLSLSTAAIVSNQRFEEMYHDDEDDEGIGFDIGGGDDDYSVNNKYDSHHAHESVGQDFGGIFGAYSSDEGNEERTFEELCRVHLREFAKGAEKYAMESQLSKRVDSWQSKVSIVLQEEEERPEFDIQSYSNRILSNAQQNIQNKEKSISDDSGEIPFVNVTKDQEPYDVSRLFLASLMLCNSENIKFSGINVGQVTSPDQLCVKVLKANIDSHVDDYFGNEVENHVSVQQMVTN